MEAARGELRRMISASSLHLRHPVPDDQPRGTRRDGERPGDEQRFRGKWIEVEPPELVPPFAASICESEKSAAVEEPILRFRRNEIFRKIPLYRGEQRDERGGQ